MTHPNPLGLGDDVLAAIDGVTPGDFANWYRALGLKALPKKRNEKHADVDWLAYQTQAPTDAEHRRWFANEPDGICLVLDGSGLCLIDCDGPREHAHRLLKAGGVDIPHACPRVVTGRDRDHFYFRTEEPVGRHIAVMRDDDVTIDVLGAGLVVAPPSLHPTTGKAYRWQPPFLDRENIPILPARVYELIADSIRPTQPTLPVVGGPIQEGERERTLTSMLGAARRRGAHETELRALAEAANQRCNPPLASRDLDRLARSIARYEPETLDVDLLITTAAPVKAAPVLDVVTPADLRADSTVKVEFVLPPYLIAGTLTDLTGAAKVGKTRFRNFLISCAVTGAPCLGYPAREPTRVVLLTEEPPASLLEGLEAAGLGEISDVAILTRYAARSADWPAMVAAAIDKARAIDARLLIVDTLPGLARLQGEAENSSGHALEALRPLQEADAPGLARLGHSAHPEEWWRSRRCRSGLIGVCGRGRRTRQYDAAQRHAAKCAPFGCHRTV